jgi:hypothetical protein
MTEKLRYFSRFKDEALYIAYFLISLGMKTRLKHTESVISQCLNYLRDEEERQLDWMLLQNAMGIL